MTDARPGTRFARRLRTDALLWLALVALVGASRLAAYRAPEPYALAIELGIAVAQVAVLLLVFMQLRGARGLIRLAAFAGLVFVAVMYVLTFNDLFTRV